MSAKGGPRNSSNLQAEYLFGPTLNPGANSPRSSAQPRARFSFPEPKLRSRRAVRASGREIFPLAGKIEQEIPFLGIAHVGLQEASSKFHASKLTDSRRVCARQPSTWEIFLRRNMPVVISPGLVAAAEVAAARLARRRYGGGEGG
ncbi:hypothetical protein KM043_011680 [Ampulex compressa]|nr:hypothetical protein KM043_011680 [Ampulex compressa]